jgi:hypothetical protein
MSTEHDERDEKGSEARGFTLQGDPQTDAAAEKELPKIDFSTFVLSLATSALYHLGLSTDPSGESPPKPNLPLARQTIDTIEMLQEKTRGNLDEEEAKLVESVLYQLHMGFVQAKR